MGLPIQGHHHQGHVHQTQAPTIPPSIVPLKGQLVSAKDSTSSARGSGPVVFVADAGIPKLANSNDLSDADMLELIGISLAKDRSTRRRSEKEKQQLQLQAGMVWQQVQVPVTTTSTTTKGSTSTTSSSSSSTTSSSSSTTSSTTSTNSSNSTSSTQKSTATVAQMKLEMGTMMHLESVLLSSVDESLKSRFHHKPPSGLMDQLQAYIHSALSSGLMLVIPPAIGLLGDPKLGLNDNPKAIEAATAVSYQNFALKWLESGDTQAFLNNLVNSPQGKSYAAQLFPNDSPDVQLSKLQALLSTTFAGVVVNSALEMTGKALGLSGYANQIRLQAQLVRDENTALADPTKSNTIATLVANRNAGIDGFSHSQLTSISSRVIHDTMFDKQGHPKQYLSHDDLVAALETNFAAAIPSNSLLAHNLAQDVSDNTVDLVIGSNRARLPSFDAINFNFGQFQNNLANTIAEEFRKSNQTIQAFTLAKEIADAVRSEIDTKQFRTEQDVRDFINNQLLNLTTSQFKDANGQPINDPEIQALLTNATNASNAVAASVNIGGPQNDNPLYNSNNQATLTPNDFSVALRMAYQDNLGVAPSSTFGNYINFVSGVNGAAGDISPSALLNQEWYHGDERSRSYLNPTAEDSSKFQQLTLGDPSAAIKEWSIQHNNRLSSAKHQQTIDD